MRLPAFSSRSATFLAANSAAPEDMPVRNASVRARNLPSESASSSVTVITSS